MPLSFCHVQASFGTRKGGASASAKLDYITREGAYTRDHDEVLSIISGNMPAWAGEHGREYFRAVDLHERANAVLFRQLEYSLPNEATKEDAEELCERFARTVAKNNHPFTVAIHTGKGGQLHAHFVWSDRINDGIDRTPETYFKKANAIDQERGGAFKSQEPRDLTWVLGVRQTYADIINEWQLEHGMEATVDPRSYAEQGIEQIPTIHNGYGDKAKLNEAYNAEVRALNSERENLSEIDKEIEILTEVVRQEEELKPKILTKETPEMKAAVAQMDTARDIFSARDKHGERTKVTVKYLGLVQDAKAVFALFADKAKQLWKMAFDPQKNAHHIAGWREVKTDKWYSIGENDKEYIARIEREAEEKNSRIDARLEKATEWSQEKHGQISGEFKGLEARKDECFAFVLARGQEFKINIPRDHYHEWNVFKPGEGIEVGRSQADIAAAETRRLKEERAAQVKIDRENQRRQAVYEAAKQQNGGLPPERLLSEKNLPFHGTFKGLGQDDRGEVVAFLQNHRGEIYHTRNASLTTPLNSIEKGAEVELQTGGRAIVTTRERGQDFSR